MARQALQFFAAPEDRIGLIAGLRRFRTGDLLATSQAFTKTISEQNWQRIALIDATAPVQLALLQACQNTGADLLLLRNSNDWHPQLAEEWSVDVVLNADGIPIQTFSPNPIASTRSVFLTTSGTTGAPKRTQHTIEALSARISIHDAQGSSASWMLTYHPASYAGLQVILTALLNRAVLIAPESRDLQGLVDSFNRHSPSHVSGTPSFWRGLLHAGLSAESAKQLRQITLGGERTDQSLLNLLKANFPNARIVHIYATTELGVIFTVKDEQAGFPADWFQSGINGKQLREHKGRLEVKQSPASDVWHPTGDLIEVVGDRVHFRGRSDGIINVGGAKAIPEEIEEVLLKHPAIAEAHVYGKPNAVVGSLVSADIVLQSDSHSPSELDQMRVDIHRFAGEHLAAHKIPRMIQFVSEIQTSPSGKKSRSS